MGAGPASCPGQPRKDSGALVDLSRYAPQGHGRDMRRLVIIAVALVLGACADPASPGSGSTEPTETGPSRVDLVEAGLRGVLNPRLDGPLFIRSDLCRTSFVSDDGKETCGEPLDRQEQRALAERLAGMSDDIRFYATYEDIPEGEAPIDGRGSVFAWTSEPDPQPDGTYHLEAGETCGGLCGHGGEYVVALRDGVWVVVGPVPGSGQWIS